MAPGDYETFEILVGTEDGQIYHACLSFSAGKNTLDYIDTLKNVFETGDYRPILDLKIAKIGQRQVVLAISDHPTTLHQFQGGKGQMATIKSCFNEYLQNPALIKEHTIRIDASSGESLLRKDTNTGGAGS